MNTSPKPRTNWFEAGGSAYAQFRPEYPAELAQYLASIAPATQHAVDVGCGNGQLTTQLADHFKTVIGLDPSEDQIRNATPHEHVIYTCAPAEKLPLEDASTDLITAAQAAHWFDLPAFYAEARRIAKPQAVIALISYGVMEWESPSLQQRFATFYRDEIGPYWPPERKLVDTGYRDIAFPFTELPIPQLDIVKAMTLADFLGYLSTWSAGKKARDAGREDILTTFIADITTLWGAPTNRHQVKWPVNMRLGTL